LGSLGDEFLPTHIRIAQVLMGKRSRF